MDTSLIIILAIVLLILIVLNHITIITTSDVEQPNCSQTAYGCCPNGVDSKLNYYGSNCPGYKTSPGYTPPPPPPSPYVPPPPQPVPPPPVPAPIPPPPKPIGGCAGTIYGCCADNVTAKIDTSGSNCSLQS
jgi:hypothetical protein